MMNKLAKLSILLGVCLAGSPLMAAGDSINWTEFTAKVFNFVVFFGGLGFLLKDPIKNFFSNRLNNIRESLAKAENSYTEANRQLEEIDAKMAKLDEELKAIETQAKADMERERKRIETQAQAEAARLIEQAKADIENKRREALRELKTFVTGLAVDEAERIIRNDIQDGEREQLFRRFTERLEAES